MKLFRASAFGTNPTARLVAHMRKEMCLVAIQKGGRMALVDHTRIRRDGMAAIAAVVVLIALAVASALPTWAQAPSAPSPAEVRPRLHGYLLDDGGGFTVIDAPDAILGTGALGINNRGEIVGATLLTRTTENGFLLAKGGFTTVQFPGTLSTGVADINERGQIVGFYLEANEGQ
jgi:hypothetical protein